MPTSGRWTGCSSKHVKLEHVPFVYFPGDKAVRDPVHARLAKRAAEKAAKVGV
jgi:hypothetical protein